jgi:hypothetical protein
MRIGIAIAAGLIAIAIGVAVTLSRSPLTVARGDSVTAEPFEEVSKPASYCQAGETLPHGTSAIRLALLPVLGPRVTVTVLSGSRVVTRGARAAGWQGASVSVPVTPVARTVAPVRVCFGLSFMNGGVLLQGWPAPPAHATTSRAGPLPGRVGIEYLRPGRRSWWSLAAATARRLGLGRAWSGTGNALLVMALVATLIVLSSWLVIRELR